MKSKRLRDMPKKPLQRLLALFGYRATKLTANELTPPTYPIEFDDADKAIFDYVLSNKLTMVSREQLISTLLASKHVCNAGVEGDFVECGVWRGGNSIIAADVFNRMTTNKEVYLFDTFAGMTEPTEADKPNFKGYSTRDRFLADQRGTHNEWCYASLEEVMGHFQTRDLVHKAKFIKGDVLRTLDDADIPQKISILRLDTDWYQSTKKELEVLWPRLQDGGILMIDDYDYWSGVKTAVDEFFAHSVKPYLHYMDKAGRIAIKH